MKKKIAIITDIGFQKKEFDRFFISKLSEKFEIFIIDFTKITHPSLNIIIKKNRIKLENFYEVNNYKDFENFFLDNKFLTTLINIGNYELNLKIIQFFKKNSLSITLIQNHVVMRYKKKLSQKISNIFYTLLDKKRILEKIRLLLFVKKNTLPLTNIFVCGLKGLKNGSIGSHTNIIKSHSNEYDIHIRSKSSKRFLMSKKEKYAIFLDQYLPFHTDAKLIKNLNRKVSEEKYYPALNSFFSLFEKYTKTRVIIAAHPKSDYDQKGKNFWYSRSYFKDKTYELIRDSSYVLAHTSTSISYAVILNKPIIFLTSNEYIKSFDNFRVHSYANYFNQPLFNIDNLNNINFKSNLGDIDQKIYKEYFDDYIKYPGSSDSELSKIFINHFAGIGQKNI